MVAIGLSDLLSRTLLNPVPYALSRSCRAIYSNAASLSARSLTIGFSVGRANCCRSFVQAGKRANMLVEVTHRATTGCVGRRNYAMEGSLSFFALAGGVV